MCMYVWFPQKWVNVQVEIKVPQCNSTTRTLLMSIFMQMQGSGSQLEAFFPPKRLGNVWRHFCLSQLGGCYWHPVIQAKEAAKHPTRHRAASTRKNNLTHNSIGAKLKKPWCRVFSSPYSNFAKKWTANPQFVLGVVGGNFKFVPQYQCNFLKILIVSSDYKHVSSI